MKKNTNDSLGKNKKIKKGKYFETITTLSLSILFAFVVLVGTQSIMGAKTTTITENKAEKYYYDGKYDEAINEYMEMQKKETWPIWTVKTAEIYSIQGNLTKSNNLLKEAIIKRDKIMLEDGEKYLEQDKELINKVIFTFYMNNNLEQAERLGEYYLNTYNTYKPLLKTMFAVYLATDQKDLAKEIVKTYPIDLEDAYDLAVLGKMQLMLKDYEGGLHNLRLAYELNKNEIKIYDVIMEVCEFDKNSLLKKVTELSEENPKVEAYKAWLEEIKSFDKNINDFNSKVINEINTCINTSELNKDSYVESYVEAWKNFNNEQYDKAKELCTEAIVRNSKYENSYILMANILYKTKRSDKGEGYIRTAIYNEPYNYNLIMNVAKLQENLNNNLELAKRYYELALNLSNNNPEIYYDLALLKFEQGNSKEAILDLKKALSISKNSKYYRALGTIYYNEGKYGNAIENIKEAYNINANDVLALNNAACYYAMVDKDIWRAYSNIESAYNEMSNLLDNESKELITKNYNIIKEIYNKYINNENMTIDVNGLELAF